MSGPRKYPIINGKKECPECRRVLRVQNFALINRNINNSRRSTCKRCHSNQNYRRQMEKKIQAWPHLYWDCSDEECNWINHIRYKVCNRCREERPGE